MSKYSRLEMIDFLNERMRPLRWIEWQMVTWEKVDKWCELLGFGSRPTKRAPDAAHALCQCENLTFIDNPKICPVCELPRK